MDKTKNKDRLLLMTIFGCFFSGALEMAHFFMGHTDPSGLFEEGLARNIAFTALLFLFTGLALIIFQEKNLVMSMIPVYTQFIMGGAILFFCEENDLVFYLQLAVMGIMLTVSHVSAYTDFFNSKTENSPALMRLMWMTAVIIQVIITAKLALNAKEYHYSIQANLIYTSMMVFTLIVMAETISALHIYTFLTRGLAVLAASLTVVAVIIAYGINTAADNLLITVCCCFRLFAFAISLLLYSFWLHADRENAHRISISKGIIVAFIASLSGVAFMLGYFRIGDYL